MSTRRALLLLLPLAGLWPGLARAESRTLRFTFSRDEKDPRTQWLIAVYRELLARLGLGFEFVNVPAGRATLMAQAGQVDGELGRSYAYQDLHPELLRLPEANNRVDFCLYGCAPKQRFEGWARVRELEWRCEFRRGISELERLLQAQLPATRISNIASIEQGLRRLQLGRVEAYLDVKEAVDDFFRFQRASPELLSGPRPRELATVQSSTGHAYLHQRHAELLQPMAQMLRRMKQEGRVQALLDEALRAAERALPEPPLSAPSSAASAAG